MAASDESAHMHDTSQHQAALVPPPVPAALEQVHELPLHELLVAARRLFENGEYEHAAAIFRYVLVRRCRRALIWIELARCHQELGQQEVATRIIEAARLATTASLRSLEAEP